MQGRNWAGAPGRAARQLSRARLIDNVETYHHGMVFMRQVVAMHHVFTREVPEAKKDLDLIVGFQQVHILAPGFMRLRWLAIPAQDTAFFQLNVNRVVPAAMGCADAWKSAANHNPAYWRAGRCKCGR